MVNAGYAETKILSRVSMENFLLMRLFAIRPDLAVGWISDPEQFREKWSANKIRKSVLNKKPEVAANYDRFYWQLCNYTHPSFKGWYELFKKQNNGVFIGSSPEFNPDYASECIGLICFAMIQSMKVYVDVFKPWIDEKMLDEANNLMQNLYQIVIRHFEVRIYDRKKLMEKPDTLIRSDGQNPDT